MTEDPLQPDGKGVQKGFLSDVSKSVRKKKAKDRECVVRTGPECE